ncbi:MAG: tRNA (N(6)-L-threonylcarbamoyladenosine(37)-C(2))-methylthiotransferase MtaB [Candidatus Omnitrophica bacterium]|nr:tRNA (N(6)-L-threonylcarbamoyladenosine(37)-C(2))-methylthiotransferase MtaB [Candidatus Omnitrophota bacterium]
MKFYIKSLGCKVNQYEEQVLRENLIKFGFNESPSNRADIIIVNSCTVTSQADIKTMRLIRKLKGENIAAKIFVTGCMAVFEDDILKLGSMPEVCRVIPGKDKMNLPYEISVAKTKRKIQNGITGFSSHTRAFLKIQDGCDNRCSYCKVSLVRGPSRCKMEKSIIDELKILIREGYKEIVLTGICLGAWKGEEKRNLPDLLKIITELKDDFRIRLSSIEPDYITEELINVISGADKICRHLHIPLQSGSNNVLERMSRNYDTDKFSRMISQIRQKMPLAGITIDIIAGFPGETESDFETTLNFVRGIKPSRMHVFRYSDRPGAPSFHFKNKVSSIVAKERVKKLMHVGKDLEKDFCRKFIDKKIEVLVEKRERSEYEWEGYTGEYVKVKSNNKNYVAGDIIKVRTKKNNELDNFLMV